jgi:hypothetical protein
MAASPPARSLFSPELTTYSRLRLNTGGQCVGCTPNPTAAIPGWAMMIPGFAGVGSQPDSRTAHSLIFQLDRDRREAAFAAVSDYKPSLFGSGEIELLFALFATCTRDREFELGSTGRLVSRLRMILDVSKLITVAAWVLLAVIAVETLSPIQGRPTLPNSPNSSMSSMSPGSRFLKSHLGAD